MNFQFPTIFGYLWWVNHFLSCFIHIFPPFLVGQRWHPAKNVAGDGFPRLRGASQRERRRGGRRCGQRRRSEGLPATRWDRASAEIPSGKHTKNHGKSQFLMGKFKMLQTLGVRTTFGSSDVVSRGRRKGLCTSSKVSKT